jgi:tRNA-2-methylthio-N6-dimethylallyladenosine synthase
VILSKDETYGDISPVRLMSNGLPLWFQSRGCDNMCTFCVVPFTRGRERNREPQSIMTEIQDFGTKVLRKLRFGQNVDSYLWYGGGLKKDFENATEMQKQQL